MILPTSEAGKMLGELVAAIVAGGGVESVQVELDADACRAILKIADAAKKENVKTAKPCKTAESCALPRNKKYEANGKRMTVAGWAEELGISPEAVRLRIKSHGSPLGKAKPNDKDKMILG